jgi:hypothetical protein
VRGPVLLAAPVVAASEAVMSPELKTILLILGAVALIALFNGGSNRNGR